MKRLRCRLFGCHNPYACMGADQCERCGAYYLDEGYVDCSVYFAARVTVSRWWSYLVYICPLHRCGHCEQWMWGKDECCSQKCEKEWFPF